MTLITRREDPLEGILSPTMEISFWPHVWAIPLTVLAGFAIGWLMRAKLDRDRDEEDA